MAELSPELSTRAPTRLLEPIERVSEALFGLIMVLTFTGSLSVADAGRGEVHTMLIGALGCNLAWGVIDGIFYLMGRLNDRGRGARVLRALGSARTDEEARRVIAGELPPVVAGVLHPEDYEDVRRKLARLPQPPHRPRLERQDWLGALAVFGWVFTITFPVAIPFLFMTDVARAMRASNAVAIAFLFLTGLAFGRMTGYHPWRSGLAMILIGGVLVAVTIALGG